MKEIRPSVPLRVLLADEHKLFREGLSRLLVRGFLARGGEQAGFEVVGRASHGEEAVVLTRREEPNLILTEVPEPLVNSRLYLRRLLGGCSPAPRIIVVTAFRDFRLARALPLVGASACLHKSASARELLSAILAPDAPGANGSITSAEPPLSERELEVVLLVARGLTNRQIARTLCVSEPTVKRHLANVFPKAGVRSRTEAAWKALAEGWISTEEVTRGHAPIDGRRVRAGEATPPPNSGQRCGGYRPGT